VPAISLYIPVYNGERLLAQTLDSVLAQSFTDFEVLCIDDCSTDTSPTILNRYAERDPRIRVLEMESNLGSVSKVLNATLGEMQGRYFVYSSQDDLFSTDWLQNMHERALATGADAVCPDTVFYYESQPESTHRWIGAHGNRSLELTGREATILCLDNVISGFMLWSAELIKRLGFADFAVNADEYSTIVLLFNCAKVVFSEGEFYYRQDNPGAVTKAGGYKDFDWAYTFLQKYHYLRENGFPLNYVVREAQRSLEQLLRMQQWLAATRQQLGPTELVEAEARSAKYELALRNEGIYKAFGID
jgi:glycosyltransferase involved in cell wall biosynthesis